MAQEFQGDSNQLGRLFDRVIPLFNQEGSETIHLFFITAEDLNGIPHFSGGGEHIHGESLQGRTGGERLAAFPLALLAPAT
jgi:hypothetical protein